MRLKMRLENRILPTDSIYARTIPLALLVASGTNLKSLLVSCFTGFSFAFIAAPVNKHEARQEAQRILSPYK